MYSQIVDEVIVVLVSTAELLLYHPLNVGPVLEAGSPEFLCSATLDRRRIGRAKRRALSAQPTRQELAREVEGSVQHAFRYLCRALRV